MDAALLILALAGEPARIDQRSVWFASPLGPLVLPVEVLPARPRALRLLAESRLGRGVRVGMALHWGAVDEALRTAATTVEGLSSDALLEQALIRWAAAEATRLGLPAEGSLAVVAADGSVRTSVADERAALAEARDLLATLAWPRWCGPLVLVPHGLDHPALAPGRGRCVRPALPVLRLPAGPTARAELTAAICDLALSLSVPPSAGWPGWLTAGVAGCARARASGSGIPERAMSERRAAAGADAIGRLLAGNPADPELATVVVAALLHPARRARLPTLLAALRRGDDGAAAVAATYGLDLATLAAPR